MKGITKDSKTYKIALKRFKAQFKDVIELTKLYVNGDNQIYAGEWLDSKGVINFNSNFAPDLKETINII